MKTIIREMKKQDSNDLAAGFREQGWSKEEELFTYYLEEQKLQQRYVIVAEYAGHAVGYTTLLPKAKHGPFAEAGLPEISDFNVLIKHQRKGIGSMILDEAERLAGLFSDVVTLGVGLHYGYGAAQRLYIKRGYIPDGSGVWYHNQQWEQYRECVNDDDLILYLSKKLR